MNTKQKIEILAPAGSYEGMKAAMNAGCDAVYIGGSSFGARAYANNLDEDTLLHAIDEAHIRDKKLYLTVNTLLKEKELTTKLYSYLEKFYLQGLDAVIVQDVGVLHFIHKYLPDLPVHASTQMTLTMAQGANLLKEYGVTRLVTSRELNLHEIKTIRQNTDLEIETFVHGALCYCYSGQCLMSSIIGGRSGNRGRCAQPCRMPYQFYSGGQKLSSQEEKYLLSPKDINTIEIIPELIEAGIDSFKIEGRMKRPEYTAAVSLLYRKYVDLYAAIGKEKYKDFLESNEYRQDMNLLMDVYNRGGFSQGYGQSYHGKKMMSLYRPNHSGVLVGEVKEIKGSQVSILVKEPIQAQDILEIRHRTEEGYEFTVKDPHKPGDLLSTKVGKRPDAPGREGKQSGKNEKAPESAIRIGDLVYRTKNNNLLEYLEKEYIAKDKKQGIQGILTAREGENLRLKVSFGSISITVASDVVQTALKQPMTREKLLAPLEKTGDTLYYFENVIVEADDNIFVPVAWLNDIRREAIHMLEEAVTKTYRRRNLDRNREDMTSDINEIDIKDTGSSASEDQMTSLSKDTPDSVGICVALQTEEQLSKALDYQEIGAIYADYDSFSTQQLSSLAAQTGKAGKGFYLSLPQICRLTVYQRLKRELPELMNQVMISGFIVKNFEEVELLQSLLINGKQKVEIILNHNMYTYNKEAKDFWREKGITRYSAPMELNYQELRSVGIEDCDMMVYGYLPVMISTQCLFESTKGCRKVNQNDKTVNEDVSFSGHLTDRLNKNFFVKSFCKSCYNILYNGQALALHKQLQEILKLKPKNIRIDFCNETSEQVDRILTLFIRGVQNKEMKEQDLTDYTTGHFKRGVE